MELTKKYTISNSTRRKEKRKENSLISAVNLSNKDKFDVSSLEFLEDYKENEITITLIGQSSNRLLIQNSKL